MKKRMMLGALALATAGLVAAFASSAVASTPTPTTTDTVAPVTTSDATATYAGTAMIHLTATDNAGGSGVSSTYFVLDGAAQVSGTAVLANTVGTHTLAFWSVDAASNTEAQNTVTFAVTAALPTPRTTTTLDPAATPTPETSGTATARIHVMGAHGPGAAGVTATLTNTLTGTAVTAITDGHGRVTFSNLVKGTYTASVTLSNGHVLTKSFRVGHDNRTITLKDHRQHTEKHVAKHGHDTVKAVAKSHTTHAGSGKH